MPGPFRTLALRNPFVEDLDRFEDLAGRCAAAGVTHLTFTELERSGWEIDDPLDPYLHWSVMHTSLLKIFPPDILRDFVPADYARRQRELIAGRAAILERSGLKGATFLYEPMYWPESVFRARPELRGPRVDHPERARHPRWSPCSDHPEVLAFYREAFRALAELSRGTLELVVIRTNDSATGFCWTNLYNGPNGPAACEGIAPQGRVNRFLEECRAGTAGGGAAARFYIGGGSIAGHDRAAFTRGLPDNCGYYSHANAGLGGEKILSGFQSTFSHYPVAGVPNPVEILDKLSGSLRRGWPDIILFTCPAIYGNDWMGEPEVVEAIAAFNREPVRDTAGLAALAARTAEALHGGEAGPGAAESWWEIFRGASLMRLGDPGTYGFYLFLTSLAQRWLTRPLVPFPEELSEAEKAHYKPWLFQSGPSHEARDLLDLEPIRLVDGTGALAFFNRLAGDGIAAYRRALALVERLEKEMGGFARLAAGLRALLCLLANLRHCVNFQVEMERFREMSRLEKNAWRESGRPASLFRPSTGLRLQRVAVNRLVRAEIDNCHELARLVEEYPGCLVETAPSTDGQTPFLVGPDLPGQLRRKAEIMLSRAAETDRLILVGEDEERECS